MTVIRQHKILGFGLVPQDTVVAKKITQNALRICVSTMGKHINTKKTELRTFTNQISCIFTNKVKYLHYWYLFLGDCRKFY